MCFSAPEVQAGGLEVLDLRITKDPKGGFFVSGKAVVNGETRRLPDDGWEANEDGVAYRVRYWTGLDLTMFGLSDEDREDIELMDDIREELVGV